MKNITIKSIRDKQKQTEEAAEKFFSKPKEEISFEDSGTKGKCAKGKCLANTFLLTIFVFVVGGIGGVLADRLAVPYLFAAYPQLNQYGFLKNIGDRTTVIKVTEDVKITQDQAIIDAIKKVSPSIVQISSSGENGQMKYKGSGIILTSNGYIITSAKIIDSKTENTLESAKDGKDTSESLPNVSYKAKLNDGRMFDVKLVEKNPILGLAMIKIEANNLPVLPLADSNVLELGERLVIIDDGVAIDIVSRFVNDYKSPLDVEKTSKPQKRIEIMRDLEDTFGGAAVVNVKGEIVGISEVGNLVIPTDGMNEFIKAVLK